MPMIMPIIVPHIAPSSGGAPSEAGMAALLAFGSVVGLKVLVFLLIACIPIGAVLAWRAMREFEYTILGALLCPISAGAFWLIFIAVVRGLMWVFA